MGVIIGPTLGPPLGGFTSSTIFPGPISFRVISRFASLPTLLTLQFVRSPKTFRKTVHRDIDWLGIGLLAILSDRFSIFWKGPRRLVQQPDDHCTYRVCVFGAFFYLARELYVRPSGGQPPGIKERVTSGWERSFHSSWLWVFTDPRLSSPLHAGKLWDGRPRNWFY